VLKPFGLTVPLNVLVSPPAPSGSLVTTVGGPDPGGGPPPGTVYELVLAIVDPAVVSMYPQIM
jgi:hypothetical protein